MSKSRETLKKYGASGQFLSMEDGDSVEAVFLFAEEIKNRFDPNKTTIRYHLKVNGAEKLLDSGSRSLSRQMAKLEDGDAVIIKRSGKFTETVYTADKAV